MKVVRMLLVVLVVLALSGSCFGYVIVYKTSCNLRTVDSEPNSLARVMMRGYLIIDVGDDNTANEGYWVTYGKDHEGTLVYDTQVPFLDLWLEGRYEIVQVSVGEEYSFTAVGKTTNKKVDDVNYAPLATSMSGNCLIQDGVVYNLDQILTGSGSVVLMWNSTQTRAANTASKTIDDVLEDIITTLETATYEAL